MKVTPTDHPASYLSSWLRLMRMRADHRRCARYTGTYGCPDYFVKLHYRQVTSENTMVDVISNLHYYNMVLVLASGTVSGIWGLILFFMKKPINRPWRISLIATAVIAALQALLGITLVLLGQKPGTGTGLSGHSPAPIFVVSQVACPPGKAPVLSRLLPRFASS